ncbi:MAG: Fe-S cluster assembly protein SufD [Planctomycetaceae bacterium]|nr:Fe-S cluster assembly protein SufD [Planctomycetaceae bacterium]
MTQLGFNTEDYQTFLTGRQEPEWVTAQRTSAWQQFSDQAWPTRREEEWMRTDIRLFNLDKFSIPTVAGTDGIDAIVPLLSEGVELGGTVHSHNGVCVTDTMDEDLKQKGVIFGSLDSLVSDHSELLKGILLEKAFDREDRFAALHAACWTGGQFLYVPRGVHVEKPFHVLSSLSDGGVDLGHTIVILEDGASAALLSETARASEDAESLHCGAIELLVGDRANLRYVNLQNWGQRVWHFARQKAVVGRDAQLQWTSAAMGSRVSKVNQHVVLDGEGARSQMNGVLFTENKQHLSYHTQQYHKKANCHSDFLYKTALQDKSHTVWRGMIKVDEGAQQTDGYQRNDNLLLSNNARADSIPGLEIEADDVRCTHGSTSGKVDEEMIYYAQCRGFTRMEAMRLIVTGFFQQIFDRITIDSVRDALGLAIARRVRDYE